MMDLDFKRLSLNFNPSEDLKIAQNQRNSISALYSLATEKDEDVDDSISELQRKLRKIKEEISNQTKFKIATETAVENLLNKMNDSASSNNNYDQYLSNFKAQLSSNHTIETVLDDNLKKGYGHLFFELQTNTNHISQLLQLVGYKELDSLIDTVVFSLYGKQYDTREEELLLQTVKKVLQYDINKSTSFTTLLRGNSVSTKIVTTYTHRESGRAYLDLVLTKTLKKALLDLKKNNSAASDVVYDHAMNDYGLYLDSKSQENPEGFFYTPPIGLDDSSLNPNSLYERRASRISSITNEIINNIISNTEKLPSGIRWICKQIMLISKKKFPDLPQDKLFSIVGGFFFLRYINPAIMLPQIYLSIEPELLDGSRALLKSIAKYIQILANKPEYSKEPQSLAYLLFFEDNIERITSFLRNICDVQDFDSSLEVEQCLFLSYGPFKLTISSIELFKIHNLFEASVKDYPDNYSERFKKVVDSLGKCPNVFNTSEKQNIEIDMAPYEEAVQFGSSSATKDSGGLSESEMMLLNTKSSFIKIIRSMPEVVEKITSINETTPSRLAKKLDKELDLNFLAEEASTGTNLKLVRWGIKAKDCLSEIKMIFGFNYAYEYRELQNQLYNDIKNLKELKIHLEKEYDDLLEVCDSIVARNRHLESLLLMYFSYISTKGKADTSSTTRQKSQQSTILASEISNPQFISNQSSVPLANSIRSRDNGLQQEGSQNSIKQKSFFPRKKNIFSPLFNISGNSQSSPQQQTPPPNSHSSINTDSQAIMYPQVASLEVLAQPIFPQSGFNMPPYPERKTSTMSTKNVSKKNMSKNMYNRQTVLKSESPMRSNEETSLISPATSGRNSSTSPPGSGTGSQQNFKMQKAKGIDILKKILDLDVIEIAPHIKYACELHNLTKANVIFSTDTTDQKDNEMDKTSKNMNSYHNTENENQDILGNDKSHKLPKKKTLVVFTNPVEKLFYLDFFYPAEEHEYLRIGIMREQLVNLQEKKTKEYSYENFRIDVSLLLFMLDKIFCQK